MTKKPDCRIRIDGTIYMDGKKSVVVKRYLRRERSLPPINQDDFILVEREKATLYKHDKWQQDALYFMIHANESVDVCIEPDQTHIMEEFLD